MTDETYAVPFSAWELKLIADTMTQIEAVFGSDATLGGLTELGQKVDQLTIDILRPETDEVAGTVRYYDGWLGFFPRVGEK